MFSLCNNTEIFAWSFCTKLFVQTIDVLADSYHIPDIVYDGFHLFCRISLAKRYPQFGEFSTPRQTEIGLRKMGSGCTSPLYRLGADNVIALVENSSFYQSIRYRHSSGTIVSMIRCAKNQTGFSLQTS